MSEMNFSDEQLSAYVDGELDSGTAQAIARALAQSSALAARIEAMHQADAALLAALDGTLGAAPALQDATPRAANVVAFPKRRILPEKHEWTRLAAAGTIAFLAGAAAIGELIPQPPASMVADSSAGLVAGPALASVLSGAHSGQRAAANGNAIAIATSFQAKDARYCREFHVDLHGSGADAVACRDAGGWRIEGWSGAPKRTAGFETASGPDSQATEATLNRLGTRAILDKSGEDKAIAAGWK